MLLKTHYYIGQQIIIKLNISDHFLIFLLAGTKKENDNGGKNKL